MRATRRSIGIALGGFLLMAFGLVAPEALADIPRGDVGWQYSESGRGYYQPPRGTPTPSQPPGPNDWVQEVLINQPAWDCRGAGIGDCDPLAIWCNPDLSPDPREPIYVRSVVRYQWKDRGDRARWHGTAECYPTPEWVPIEQLSYDFKYEIQRNLPRPKISLHPAPKTLVNLPTIVSVDDPGTQTFDITVPPSQGRHFELHGQITAIPEYTWTFSDANGDAHTVKGAGREFDGTLPDGHPGYYVTNTFGAPGEGRVHLQVRWTGTVVVDTVPPQPIVPVTFDVDANVQVVESHPVLGR